MKNIKIKVYEDLTNCEMNSEQEDSYIEFCQNEMDKLYPDYEIEIVNEQSLDKVVINGDFGDDFGKESDLKEEIEEQIAWMFEKWDK